MKRKNILIGAALGVVLALTGCSVSAVGGVDEETGYDSGKLKAYTVTLPSGGTVVCVTDTYTGSSGGGTDCDWENAK